MSGFYPVPQIMEQRWVFSILLKYNCKQFKLFWKWRQTCLNLPLCQLLDKRTYGGFILLWSFRCQGRCMWGEVRGREANFQIISTYFDRFGVWHRSCQVTFAIKSQPSIAGRASGLNSLQLSTLAPSGYSRASAPLTPWWWTPPTNRLNGWIELPHNPDWF